MRPYTLVRCAEDIPQVASFIHRAPVFGLDIETTALEPRDGQIRLLQVSDGETTYVVDVFQTRGLGVIVDALANSSGIKVGQNLKFEQKWFKFHHNVELWPLFDTFRASSLIYNGKNLGHNLYDIYARELGLFPSTDDMGGSDWKGPLTQEQYDYAAEDSVHLLPLREVLRKKLVDLGLLQIALIEFGAILPEAATELEGFYLDKDAWRALAAENRVQAEIYRKKLLAELPNPSNQISLPGFDPDFNLDSNDQVLRSLQKLGLKRKIETEEGETEVIPLDSTMEIVLAQYATEYPIINDLFKYREYSKNLTSFGEGFLDWIDWRTGRIHTSYFPFTGAGRYSSRNPNCQQIPRDPRFRRCFQAPPKRKLVAADYAGVEMRIGAEQAKDKVLTEAFLKGLDAHKYTASLVNNISYDEVSTADKQKAKSLNFGLIYGMGAPKLVLYAMSQYKVAMSLPEATRFRNKFFEAYRGIASWHDVAYRDGQRTRMVRNMNGRIRYFLSDKVYSEFFNTPVQSVGADALKKSLREVYFRLRKTVGDRAKIVHHVHDEIIVEADDDTEVITIVKAQLQAGMFESLQGMLKTVPAKVDAKEGDTWADVK